MILFKKPIIQCLQLVALIPNILLSVITVGLTLLDKWLRRMVNQNQNTKKYQIYRILLNVFTLGLPLLNNQLGKLVSWCQNKINSYCDQIANMKSTKKVG